MKTNFVCPKCKHKVTVGKHQHASWQCPNCHRVLILQNFLSATDKVK